MEGANLKSIDAVTRFKAVLADKLTQLRNAVDEADTEVDRMKHWLQSEGPHHWKAEVRKRQESVVNAKSALFRKEMITSSRDQKPSVVDEQKALARAKAKLEDGERIVRAIEKWRVGFPREEILYKGAMAPLSHALERDLPHAIGVLNRMALALEKYVQTAPPDLSAMVGPPEDEDAGPSMRRTGGDAPAPSEAPPEEGQS